MIPSFAGTIIDDAWIDYGLHLRTADHWEILLAAPVEVSGPGEPPTELDVDVAGSPLPVELEEVVGATITEVLVADDGGLGVVLGDRRLVVHPDDYEAWQIVGRNRERLICMPGGELAYFPPATGDDSTPEPEPAGEAVPSPPQAGNP